MALVLSGFALVASAGLIRNVVLDPAAAGTTLVSLLLLACIGVVIVVATFVPRVMRKPSAGRPLLVGALLVVGATALIGAIVLFTALL